MNEQIDAAREIHNIAFALLMLFLVIISPTMQSGAPKQAGLFTESISSPRLD